MAATASRDSGFFNAPRLATESGSAPRRIFFTGSSSFLPDRVVGMEGSGMDLVGHVAGRQAAAQRLPDRVDEVIQPAADSQSDEQHQHPGTASIGVFEVHDQAVGDTVDGLDHAVDLAGPDAHAATVQRGVGTAGDGATALLVERDPVAVPPHPRVRLEVRGPQPRAVGVAPEADRHRRHRPGDHQLALLADDRPAGVVECFDR